MSTYVIVGTQTSASKTALTAITATTIQPRILQFTISNIGTVSVDSGAQIQLKKFTAAGTTTAVTPAATDGSPAATFTAGSNATVEPTYTANTTVFDRSVNPRSTYTANAYDFRAEWVFNSTAANGYGWFVNALGGFTTVNVEALIQQ